MVGIGTVWDRTMEVLRGRAGMLAGIAALTIVLPTVIRNGLALMMAGGTPGQSPSLLFSLISLIVFALAIVGQLALVAAATDPATLRDDALRTGLRRLAPAIGLYLIVVIGFIIALIPIGIAAAASGVDLTRMGAGTTPKLSVGIAGFVTLYAIALVLAGLWLSARLFVLNPVIVNERLGVKAFARSFALTRGHVWRLIGFLLLVGVVLIVSVLATQFVIGTVTGLIFSPVTARFWTSIPVSILTAAYTVLIATFAAQFYVSALAETQRDMTV